MRDFRLYSNLLLVTIAFMLPIQFSALAVGQDDSFENMKRQIEELQAKLDQASNQNSEKATFQEDERVREVGRQIIKRRREESTDDIALQIRLYDLSDLFAASPSYPAKLPQELQPGSSLFASRPAQQRGSGGGGFGGGGGGGVFCITPTGSLLNPPFGEDGNLNMQSAQVTLGQLVETIKETVKPEMWGSSGTSARIKFLGNSLLITATADMHLQINNLLNLFREHWGKRRTISIQAYWVRADHGVAEDLFDADTTANIGDGVVSKEKWAEFFAKARADKQVIYSATLTGHNNQTLHALSGKQVRLTVDAKPFRESSTTFWVEDAKGLLKVDDGEHPFGEHDNEDEDETLGLNLLKKSRRVVGFTPIQTNFHNGAAIQVTPLATRGGNFVILDLQSKINELVEGKAEKNERIFLDESKEKHELELDNLDFVACRFNSTLRCPKDEVILAGSMTFDPSASEEKPEVYLFVRASVHTIKEDESDRKQGKVVDPEKEVSEPAGASLGKD